MMDATREAFRAIDRAMTGDSRVLEVGCGSGEMAERMAALPGVSLVATDYSEDCVELTAQRGVDARHADVCYLPFDPASFDVVYAGWVLDHVRDTERALAEIRRVLRPGGKLVLETMHRDRLIRSWSDNDWRLMGEGRLLLEQRTFDPAEGVAQTTQTLVETDGTRESRTWTARVYSATELVALCKAAGFGEVKCWGGFEHEPFTSDTRLVIVATR